jgi:transposase
MDGVMFLAYVKEFLCPALKPGDLVIGDNLSSHKVAGVADAIEAAGARFIHLPPYSPDLNPIEKLFTNSRPCCARPPNAAAQRSGPKSETFWITSHPRHVSTTSIPRDLAPLKSKLL